MTFSIFKKLMLAFIGLTLLVLVATLGLARWSFERGFLDYVNALEQTRLETLAGVLEQEYVRANNRWSNLTHSRFESVMNRQEQSFERNRGHPHGNRPQSDHGPAPDNRSHSLASDTGRPPRVRPGDPGFLPSNPPPGPRSTGDARRGAPTALYSTAGQHLVGVPDEHIGITYISVPVMANGKVIGELRSAPRRQFESPQETALSRQQWMTSALIAFIALLLALIASALLSRLLLAPIRRLIEQVSQLSNGDYNTRLNEQRKDEIGQLMTNLDRLSLTLEQNQASRKRWLADISHELRTPMTILTGTIETMKDGIRPLNMEQVVSMDQEVTRLRHLVDDLYQLSLSDIGGLRYHFEPVSVGDCIQRALASVQSRALQQNIQIVFQDASDGQSVRGDEQRLQQLLTNLLENSLRYTDAPGMIRVTLTHGLQTVAIHVEDTPPGVPAEDCESLFDPLYRQDSSRSRHRAGAGLGLAICRNIVLAHHGTISARPADTGGLSIDIELPV